MWHDAWNPRRKFWNIMLQCTNYHASAPSFMIFKMFANGESGLSWAPLTLVFNDYQVGLTWKKNIIFYFILFTCWVSIFGLGYGFGNSKAYYGPREFYTGPGPSVDSTHGIASWQSWHQSLGSRFIGNCASRILRRVFLGAHMQSIESYFILFCNSLFLGSALFFR